MKLLDRSTGDVYEIKISDGQLNWTVVAQTEDSEPIVEDEVNVGTYWKIFIDNGMLGFEETATVQNDTVSIVDDVTNVIWSLGIYDGQIQYVQTGVTGNLHGHILSTASFLDQILSNVSYLDQLLGVGI